MFPERSALVKDDAIVKLERLELMKRNASVFHPYYNTVSKRKVRNTIAGLCVFYC